LSKLTADDAAWFMLKLTQVPLHAIGVPPIVQPVAASRSQLLHVLVRQ